MRQLDDGTPLKSFVTVLLHILCMTSLLALTGLFVAFRRGCHSVMNCQLGNGDFHNQIVK